MPCRPFSVCGRMRPASIVLARVSAPLLSGCTDTWQHAAAGQGTVAPDDLLFCAVFNVRFQTGE